MLRLPGLLCAVAWTAATAAGQPLPYQVIAKTGDQSAGTAAGVTFAGLGRPLVAPDGWLVFGAGLAGTGVTGSNDQGVWSWSAGQSQLVARTGSPLPGADSRPLQAFGMTPAVTTGGTVAFRGILSFSSPATGIWAGSAGGLQQVALTGQPAPGTAGTFSSLPNDPHLAADGRVLFRGTASVNEGVWFGTPGNLQLVALEGATAPGTGGASFALVTVEGMSASGVAALWNTLVIDGVGVTTANSFGIWSGTPGNVQLVMRGGSPAPQTGGTVSGFRAAAVLATGQTVVSAIMAQGGAITSANNEGLWVGTSSADLQLAIRKGDQVPGTPTGVVLAGNGFHPIANGSRIAFAGTLSGQGVTAASDGALLTWSAAGGLSLLAREGDAAPGAGGVVFADLAPGRLPSVSDDGSVAFIAALTGTGVTEANDVGIWRANATGLRLVAREGDVIDLDPGPGTDLVTISELRNFNSWPPDPSSGYAAFDAQGGLAWTAVFTDGRSAIFYTPVPEPTALLAVAAGGLFLLRLRRRASAG
jgi:hypothetical protein